MALLSLMHEDEFSALDECLMASIEPVAPPAAIRQRLLASVRTFPRRSETVREDEGGWSALKGCAGVRTKLLRHDPARHLVTCLLEMAPGARMPAHPHHGSEQSFVVSGSCRIGSVTLSEGDFHAVEAGSEHGDVTTDDGCVLLLIVDERDCFAA